MRIFEAIQQTVVIYPGRFHPFHKGHAAAFKYLADQYGKVFISTSNKVDPPKSPFTFAEKKQMMIHAGIPSSAIVQTKNPYQAVEITQNYDPEKTVLIFAVSEKDMDEDPRFRFAPKKDGSPSYFQPLKSGTLRPFSKHGYITTVPTLDFTVLGEPMRSATELRANFSRADDDTQKQMIVDLYGTYDPQVHSIMQTKIKEGKSPHKKGTKKYKKHMAAMHANMSEVAIEDVTKESIPPDAGWDPPQVYYEPEEIKRREKRQERKKREKDLEKIRQDMKKIYEPILGPDKEPEEAPAPPFGDDPVDHQEEYYQKQKPYNIAQNEEDNLKVDMTGHQASTPYKHQVFGGNMGVAVKAYKRLNHVIDGLKELDIDQALDQVTKRRLLNQIEEIRAMIVQVQVESKMLEDYNRLHKVANRIWALDVQRPLSEDVKRKAIKNIQLATTALNEKYKKKVWKFWPKESRYVGPETPQEIEKERQAQKRHKKKQRLEKLKQIQQDMKKIYEPVLGPDGIELDPEELLKKQHEFRKKNPGKSWAVTESYSQDIDAEWMEKQIRASAKNNGIDPNIAVRVWKSEGGMSQQSQVPRKGSGSYAKKEDSWGPFQLFLGGGVGNKYVKHRYGKDTAANRQKLRSERSKADIKKQIAFALKTAKENGWGSWHGAANVGIGNWDGIGSKSSPSIRITPNVAHAGTLPKPPKKPTDAPAASSDWFTWDKEGGITGINLQGNYLDKLNKTLSDIKSNIQKFATLDEDTSMWNWMVNNYDNTFWRGIGKEGKGTGLGALGKGVYLSWEEGMANAFAGFNGTVAKYKVKPGLNILDVEDKDFIDIKAEMGMQPWEYSDDPMFAGMLTMMAKEKGYDGIVSDDVATGIVIFDENNVEKQEIEESENTSCPRTKASVCECDAVNNLTEAEQTVTAVVELEHSDTVTGNILLKQEAGGPTLIVGKIAGLAPGKHGFHIHEYGDLSKGCESAGAHYNPDNVDHGDIKKGHVGDLGNIEADDSGTANIKLVANRVDLLGERSVVGRAVVVHEDEDDLGKGGDAESLKTGNAGNRLACGVITVRENLSEGATSPHGDFELKDIAPELRPAVRQAMVKFPMAKDRLSAVIRMMQQDNEKDKKNTKDIGRLDKENDVQDVDIDTAELDIDNLLARIDKLEQTVNQLRQPNDQPELTNELKIEKPDVKNWGIPRDKMPQVHKDNYPEFLNYLSDNGVTFTKTTMPASDIKPIQGEFSDAGVIKALVKRKTKKPSILSSDNYIIDGHHRWLASLNTGTDVLVYKTNIPASQLLELVLKFPKTYFKGMYNENAAGRVVKGVNTTPDVGPNEIKKQAKKLGFNVDKDGRPPIIHKKAAKNSDPNTLFNLGITESIQDKKILIKFANFCKDKLKLPSMPNINFVDKIDGTTFGQYDTSTNDISLQTRDRHILDIMRTLAHELVHHKQRCKHDNLDGSDGSDHENQANAAAGVILRNFGRKNPRLYESLEERGNIGAVLSSGLILASTSGQTLKSKKTTMGRHSYENPKESKRTKYTRGETV